MASFDWLSDLSPLYEMRKHWEDGTYTDNACFHLYYDHDGPFNIVSGASLLAKHIRSFQFDLPTIRRLGQVTDGMGRSVFDEGILNHLQRMRLRLRLIMPNEGTLLFPNQPLCIISGPIDQIKLMESTLRHLILNSSHWATLAAIQRWERGDLTETDTPIAPDYEHNPEGWKMRGAYMGGVEADKLKSKAEPKGRLEMIWQSGKKSSPQKAQALEQVRRLFDGDVPLGDVFLKWEEEPNVSVSERSISLKNEKTNRKKTIEFSRFLNLYQLVLYKGHSVYTTPKLEYRRQRTLHNLEYFAKTDLEKYPMGDLVV